MGRKWTDFKRMHFRCWFSKYFWDIHDWRDDRERGMPIYSVTFRCTECKKEFVL